MSYSFQEISKGISSFNFQEVLAMLRIKLGLIKKDEIIDLVYPFLIRDPNRINFFDYNNQENLSFVPGNAYVRYKQNIDNNNIQHLELEFVQSALSKEVFVRPDEISYHINEYLNNAVINLGKYFLSDISNPEWRKLISDMKILRDIKIISKAEMMSLKKIGVSYDNFTQDIFDHNNNLSQILTQIIDNTKPLTIKEYTKLYGYATSSDYSKNNDPETRNYHDAIYLCEETISNVANNISSHEDTLLINKRIFKSNIQKKRTKYGTFDKNTTRTISKHTPVPTLEYLSNNWFKLVLYHELGHILLGDNNNTERNAQTLASIFARNILDSLCIEYISYFQDEEYQNAPLWGLDFNE